jgi:hypothetical protein
LGQQLPHIDPEPLVLPGHHHRAPLATKSETTKNTKSAKEKLGVLCALFFFALCVPCCWSFGTFLALALYPETVPQRIVFAGVDPNPDEPEPKMVLSS